MELVAVVAIISIFAALAIPVAVNQLRDRHVFEAARRTALLYRQARLHAMGRGGAVLVNFNAGAYRVLEAVQGTHPDPNCRSLPVASCTDTVWETPASVRAINSLAAAGTGELSDLTLTLLNSAGTTLNYVDVCFTPLGRPLVRFTAGSAFSAMDEAFVARAARDTSSRTLPRQAVLMPNGTARMMALEAP